MGVVDGRYAHSSDELSILKANLLPTFVNVKNMGVLGAIPVVDSSLTLGSDQPDSNQLIVIFEALGLYDTRTNFKPLPILIRCCSHAPVSCAESFIVQSPVMLEISSSPLAHGTIHPLAVSAPWTW